MVEPGTAAIAVLSTIAGLSGYGAMKVNQNQSKVMDETANRLAAEKIEKVRRELTLATEEMKAKAERELKAKQLEVDKFKQDIEELKAAESKLQSKLQQATEGERLFSSVSLPEFKKAIQTFQKDPELNTLIDTLDEKKKKAVEKVFENYTSSMRLRISRGSLQSLFQDLTNAAGQSFIDRISFDKKLTDILRNVSSFTEKEIPTPAPAPVVPAPAPVVPAPELAPQGQRSTFGSISTPQEQPVVFGPQASRILAAKERAANQKKGNIQDNVMTRIEDARTEPSPFAQLPSLSSTVPTRSIPRIPPPPPVRATRRKGKIVPPTVPKGGLRKKKLRSRRATKQKNVRRTRRS